MALKTTEKTELIVSVNEQKSSPGLVSLAKLLHILISETREENDSVDLDNLCWNQGKITAYRVVLDIIIKGIPQLNR